MGTELPRREQMGTELPRRDQRHKATIATTLFRDTIDHALFRRKIQQLCS
jgi:hypothetical protein